MSRRDWIPGKKGYALILSGLVIGAAFLWVTLTQVHIAEVKRSLLDPALLAFALPSLLAYALVFWFKALRWRMLLFPVVATNVRTLIPSVLIGYVSNLLLPVQLGELLRVYVLGTQLQIEKAPILGTIVVERMFDFLTLLLLLAVVLSTAADLEVPTLRIASFVVGGMAFGLLAVMVVGLSHPDRVLGTIRRLERLLPAPAIEYVATQVERGIQGLLSIRSPWLLFRIALASVAMWVAMAVTVYLSLLALRIDVPLSAAVVVLALTVVGFTLPAIPGYIGTVQLSFLLALHPYGIGPDSAVAASIFYHVLITFPPLLAAGYAFTRLGIAPLKRT